MALISCSLSEEQEALLIEHFRQVAIVLDRNEAGRKANAEIATRLARCLHVRIVDMPEGSQPDQLSTHELQELLRNV